MASHISTERNGSHACRRFVLLFALMGAWSCLFSVHGQDRAAWMPQARWGVMTHYLADWRARADHEPMSVEHWNDLVDHFDVEGLADQIKSTGAGYHLLSIGQNSGYYLAPNAT